MHNFLWNIVYTFDFNYETLFTYLTSDRVLCRLSVQCDSDDGEDDEVVFKFTADRLLSTSSEVCSVCYNSEVFGN